VSIHLLILLAIYFIFKPNFIGLVTAVFGTVIIDADHIFLIKKQGIAGYLSLRSNREFRKPRKYLFHNIYLIASFALFTPFIFSKQTFLIGIFAFSVFSHLLWDFLEDILIFHMNIKHWKL
jgi:UPF0716 family protein affecting phage T7 exclusion